MSFFVLSTKGNLMACGKIKWFNNKLGFGFILQDSGQDVFVHYSSIEGNGYKTLFEGDVVDFEIISGERGPKAQRVRRISRSQERPYKSIR